MPITTWIRDLLGIPKDIVDLKKSKLEVTKLEAEQRQRNFITPASLDDVRKYDPNVQKLEREIKRRRGYGASERLKRALTKHPTTFAILVLIFLTIALIVGIVTIIRGA